MDGELQMKPTAHQVWIKAIEDQSTLLLTPVARHRYLLTLVVLAKRQGVPADLVIEMFEITDAALMWAQEELM
ncbi:hypothetical protein [Pseudomonas ovata]|uniref:hypothetical protein n=1 Tax=Pseudomonas ovata TaxID=1839709 RepID=UPI001260238B|nr:hypothetical protein [Pseudomonas ovata]